MTTAISTRIAAAALAVACVGFATGCTKSRGSSGSTATAIRKAGSGSDGGFNGGPSSAPATSAVGLPSGVVGATSLPANVPNDVGLRKNVDLTSCAAVDGGWGASGRATNPGASVVNYTITVFFTTTSATVIDTAQSTVKVEPGQTMAWNLSKQFHAAPTMLCVLRGVG